MTTTFDWEKFNREQIEWHKKQIEWETNEIKFLTEMLTKQRKGDREFVEWMRDREDSEVKKIVLSGKWMSTETRQLLNERKRAYRRRKNHRKWIAYYEKEGN